MVKDVYRNGVYKNNHLIPNIVQFIGVNSRGTDVIGYVKKEEMNDVMDDIIKCAELNIVYRLTANLKEE